MKKSKMFFIWQDNLEETWLNEQSQKGHNLDSVKFPFIYHFNDNSNIRYSYYLNAPKDSAVPLDAFIKYYHESGWAHIGQMNGWHYFRKEDSGKSSSIIEGANESKAAKFQKSMILLVGLLPFLLFIFPAIGKRIPSPLFGVLRIVYFVFLGLYTLVTYKVYHRVNQLRDL